MTPELVQDPSPFAGQPIGPRNISHSQLAHKCGYALGFHRQRRPWPNRSISLLYGSGLHAGLEEWHLTHNLEAAIKIAERTLNQEVQKDPPVRWDEKRGPAHKAAIPDLLTAHGMLRQHLTAWDTMRKGWQGHVLETERTIWVDITRSEKAWKLQCRIDAIVEEDKRKGIEDYKSAGKAWTAEKLEEHKAQAYLYMGAEWSRTKVAPAWFRFWVFIKGKDEIVPYQFDFDAPTINRYIEHTVLPTIKTIEVGAFIPNTDFWGHSKNYCEYWGICPLGEITQRKEKAA